MIKIRIIAPNEDDNQYYLSSAKREDVKMAAIFGFYQLKHSKFKDKKNIIMSVSNESFQIINKCRNAHYKTLTFTKILLMCGY